MTISEHFYLQVFLGQTFLYFNFQSSNRGVFQIATKHQRLSFHKNKQIFSVSIINVSTQSWIHFRILVDVNVPFFV